MEKIDDAPPVPAVLVARAGEFVRATKPRTNVWRWAVGTGLLMLLVFGLSFGAAMAVFIQWGA